MHRARRPGGLEAFKKLAVGVLGREWGVFPVPVSNALKHPDWRRLTIHMVMDGDAALPRDSREVNNAQRGMSAFGCANDLSECDRHARLSLLLLLGGVDVDGTPV